MPPRRINLHEKVRGVLAHADPLPVEAATPFAHFTRSGMDLLNLLSYIERNFNKVDLVSAARRRHMGRVHGMIAVSLVETFERYLKEAAAVCVDFLAPFVLDDRFNAFKIQGSSLASHFGADTLGRSLCESATWLDCDEVNQRFRRLLADPFEAGNFDLFPKRPAAERENYDTLGLIWQLRHTIVHNVGVITQSDAIKLRLLVKSPVASLRVLVPTRDDVRYLKRFLDETAARSNGSIGKRLAELLTSLHATDATLFDPQDIADRAARIFGFTITIAGAIGVPPL